MTPNMTIKEQMPAFLTSCCYLTGLASLNNKTSLSYHNTIGSIGTKEDFGIMLGDSKILPGKLDSIEYLSETTHEHKSTHT